MNRALAVVASVAVALLFVVPIAVAADPITDPLPHSGRILISTEGDISVPAGDHVDTVIVIRGHAQIAGEVNSILAVDGSVTLSGATTESVVAINSSVEVGPGSVVRGDVLTLGATVHQTGDAEVLGEIKDLAATAVGIGAVLGPVLILLWIGFGLATMVAGWLLAALAGRQARAAESLINRRPLAVLGVGFLGLIATPIVAGILMATIVGAPLGFGMLILVWPVVAFLGYLVAAVWVGDWVLARTSSGTRRERPFLAVTIGLLVLLLTGLIPVLALLAAIASLLGFGAVLLLAWQTLRGEPGQPAVSAPQAQATPSPVAG